MSSFLEQEGTPSNDQNQHGANTEAKAGQFFEQQGQQSGLGNDSQENDFFLEVGDRKFKSQEDAVHHISSAQEHIQKLESDFEAATGLLDRQQQLLDKSRNIDDVMEAVARRDSSGNAEDTPQLSKEEVVADAIKAFEQKQEQQTLEQRRQANWDQVTGTLTQSYGDKTDEVVQKVAGENGLSIQEASEMARTHPKVFLKMFDTTPRYSAQPSIGSVNTQNINQPAERPHKPLTRMSMKERASEVQRRLQELS